MQSEKKITNGQEWGSKKFKIFNFFIKKSEQSFLVKNSIRIYICSNPQQYTESRCFVDASSDLCVLVT